MKLVYVNCENTSVMEGQVLSLLKYYNISNQLKDIILLQGFSNNIEKNILQKKLTGFNSKIVWFKRWPSYTVFNNFFYFSIKKILDQLGLDDKTIIHVRGELYGAIIQRYLYKTKSTAKLLVDIRGVVIEEIENYSKSKILLKKNKILFFKNAYKKISNNVQITVISEAFKEYLIEGYGFCRQNIYVHPNIADKQFTYSPDLRQKFRKELGLHDDDIVAICSSNGNAAWQKDKDVIIPLISLDVKVINLSSSTQEIPGVVNKLIPFDSMPGYLAAADIAILWRDNNIVNEVASPSKYSEFAAMGLWVIHNDSVKIAANFIRQNKTGIIVNSIKEIKKEVFNSFQNYDRVYKSTIGRKEFGVENISKSYIALYEKIL
jgi:hypothetical protein